MTPLDLAHAAMLAEAEDDAARLRFYDRLIGTELVLLLESEAEGEVLTPRVFDLEEGPVVLAFDSEERLARFSGGISAYAALPGRVVARMLAGQGLGLGLNLGVAPSSMLLPPEAMTWLASTLETAPEQTQGLPVAFLPSQDVPPALVDALEAKLAPAAQILSAAVLAAARYDDGRTGFLLALVGAPTEAEQPLANACAEAMVFCGLDQGTLDVAFRPAGDDLLQALAPVAVTLHLPPPPTPQEPAAPKAPGSDPDRPPILR